jgi:predicted pyridoxine 5'-phosphate oxidase superfamily flavin-nucleotide-binding protein
MQMDDMDAVTVSSDVAFTSAVKAQQTLRGSRRMYEKLERSGGWQTRVTADLRAFIEQQDSFFLATANADGQPYIQHRGGPAGFLHMLDEGTLGFADFAGNRQYITLGNLTENSRVHLFLIDYVHRQRVKIWGTARFVEGEATLLEQLTPRDYKARPERVILIEIAAWDLNCRQHIPQLLHAEDVAEEFAARDQRILTLQGELARLRQQLAQQTHAVTP